MSGDEELDAGLLGIALSDSDAEPEPGDDSAVAAGTKTTSQESRTAQSEAAFEEVKRTYRVKIENGEMWKTVRLPLGLQVSKPEAQALLHAVEELYFFRRFTEGARLARSVIDDAGTAKLDEDTLNTMLYYEGKCNDRIGNSGRSD